MHPLGTVLQDRYRIEAVLGRGGMGNVYLARHVDLDRVVALKEMLPNNTRAQLRDAAMRQFRQEAIILHRLDHPRLPKVLDFFEIDGNPYLVMEYIKGRTLLSVVENEDPLPESLVRHWALELCEVLEYLHTNEPAVVFRDLKPANIMLDAEGDIKLIDFGISKIFDIHSKSSTNTFARGCVSPGFTAPEQYAGNSEPKSDVYSLGATLYYLLTGTIPAGAVERAADLNSLTPLRTLRPDVSETFATGIETLMTLRAQQRPGNWRDVRGVLGLQVDAAPAAPEPSPSEPAPRRVGLETIATRWQPSARPASRGVGIPHTRLVGRSPRRISAALSLVAVCATGLLVWPALHAAAPPPPPPVPAAASTLVVTTHPDGARVLINGREMGLSPLTVPSVSPGVYAVLVEKEGFRTSDQDVLVHPGETRSLAVDMVAANIPLRVTAWPGESQLTVDGGEAAVLKGTTTVHLAAGRHLLEISHPGYATKRWTLDVSPSPPPSPIIIALARTTAGSPTPQGTPSASASPAAP